MGKITIAGDAIVITSAAKVEDIKTLEKYRPRALSLYEKDEDGKNQEVFCVGMSKHGDGSVSKYNIFFAGEARDGSGQATVTLTIPSDVEDAKEYVADKYGFAVMCLNKIEAQFESALAEVQADRDAVMGSITTV